MFPQFLKMVTDVIAPKLSIIFRGLIRRGSFPECWSSANVTAIPKGAPSPDKCWPSANVTAIPKGAPSPDRENYLPIINFAIHVYLMYSLSLIFFKPFTDIIMLIMG